MIVPQFWAESRVQHRGHGRQVTVHRFGWSDVSQEAAQQHAEERAEEAMRRVEAGERLPRRDPKVPYNGAEGVPIREEIISRHGETIITRNSYGAHCLNTPDVLFADIDFSEGLSCSFVLTVLVVLLLGAAAAGWASSSWTLGIGLAVVALVLAQAIATALHRALTWRKGDESQAARERVMAFLDDHPAWNLVLYRTPAGLRVLATHQTFVPRDPIVTEFFDALGTDPLYARMCFNQQCFRARVTAKPWRIGIDQHMKPRPGIWPVNPKRLPERNAWIAQYESAATGFAACRLIETVGSGTVHPDAQAVRELHDKLSRAESDLTIA